MFDTRRTNGTIKRARKHRRVQIQEAAHPSVLQQYNDAGGAATNGNVDDAYDTDTVAVIKTFLNYTN